MVRLLALPVGRFFPRLLIGAALLVALPFTTVTSSRAEVVALIGNRLLDPGEYTGNLVGRALDAGVTCRLRHRQSGDEVALEVERTASTDTLRVSGDLRAAQPGLYDLLVEGEASPPVLLPGSLYVGEAPVLRVPRDYTTIGAAIRAAVPGSDIQVDEGTYLEHLVIDKPLRLLGGRWQHLPQVRCDTVGVPVITILPAAGAMTEVAGFLVRDGQVEGEGGAGIRCLAPVTIRGVAVVVNRAVGAGARGGGVFAVAGARLIGNDIGNNFTNGPGGSTSDPWREDPSSGGIGGGLYCVDCLVRGNLIAGNIARLAGGPVVDGTVVDNQIRGNQDYELTCGYEEGACRGEFLGNTVGWSCGESFLIGADSRVEYNVFQQVTADLCGPNAGLYLRGPMDFQHNTLAGYTISACLARHGGTLPSGRFVFRHNLLSATSGFDGAWANISLGFCDQDCWGATDSLDAPFPPESLDVGCNFGRVYVGEPGWESGEPAGFCSVPVCNFGPDDWNCEGAFDLGLIPNSAGTEVCGEVAGAKRIGCGVPVLLTDRHATALADGIHLTWRAASDAAYDGYWIEREADARAVRLNDALLAPCTDCEFIDRTPEPRVSLRYFAVPVERGVEGARELIGEATWVPGAPRLSIDLPRPHPLRAGSMLRFSTRAAGPVTIELIDVAGRRAGRLLAETMDGGAHELAWTGALVGGRRPPAGVYTLRLSDGQRSVGRRVLLLP
ncbi:MAG: hypothetical protein U0527_09510 [Candidatus Eisenbacteria bacterium]